MAEKSIPQLVCTAEAVGGVLGTLMCCFLGLVCAVSAV